MTPSILSTAVVLACFCVFPSSGLHFTVSYEPGERYRMLERSDLRRYEGARFIGFSYREVRGILSVTAADPGLVTITGDYFVLEETRHNTRHVARRIDRVEPASFSLSPVGHYDIDPEATHPSLRSFPVFPAVDLKPGDRWQDFGERVVEPLRDGVYTRVRFYCDYRYTDTQVRSGRSYEVTASPEMSPPERSA